MRGLGAEKIGRKRFETVEEKVNIVLQTLIECSEVEEMRRQVIGKLICFCLFL